MSVKISQERILSSKSRSLIHQLAVSSEFISE